MVDERIHIGDNVGVDSTGDALQVLMDTNVVLAIEGDIDADHVNSEQACEVFRLIHEQGGKASILENQLDDFSRITDPALQKRRQRQLRKYSRLTRVTLTKDFLVASGYSDTLNLKSNDGVDAALLLALSRNAASWLLTEDKGIHSHARQLGLGERVMRLSDALFSLKSLKGEFPPHYTVDKVEPHVVDPSQAIFHSLNVSYPDFESWWIGKVVPQRRPCFIIGSPSNTRGVAVLDDQDPNIEGFPGRSIKICTFKIEEQNQGRKLGETLLEAVIAAIRSRSADGCFIEVDIEQVPLITLLREFGFFELRYKTGSDSELVMGKILNPEVDSLDVTDPLEYNRRYGPGRRLVKRTFVVPIIPEYHRMLFPSAEPQLSFFESAYGNAVRKVYICHSPIKALIPGDALLFYRTHTNQAIHAVGVVEDTLRTRVAAEVFSFAGARTVYSAEEIRSLCEKEVLAIKFRLDQVFQQPAERDFLRSIGVMESTPQSIARLGSKEAVEWAQSMEDA